MLQNLQGKWALVTGASSGIGRAFCEQLAGQGINLVMVARRERVLQDLANNLSSKHRIEAIAESIDLSERMAGKTLKQRVEKRDIHISLLINNAGAGAWGYFEQVPIERYEAMLRLNINAMVTLCYSFLPDLESSKPAAVINVSSQAAYQPVPYMAVYAASKAFVQSFSQALHGEWQDKGIEVQTLVPGPTKTEFDKNAGAYESAVSHRDDPQIAVRVSLAALGRKHPVVASVKGTYKQRILTSCLPARVIIKSVKKMFHPPF